MAFDQHANFGYSTVLVAPVPAAAGNSLTVQAGHGALFPTAPFNCTVWPSGVSPLASNAEIVRVTAVVGDTLTIVRAQEGTSAVVIAVGFQIANTTSKLVFTDIEQSIIQFISAGTTKAGASEVVFADGNNISFFANGQTISGSVLPPAGGGGVAISAGANSQSTGTVAFVNANGITFGLDGVGNLTASHDGITSQSNQAFSASGGSSTFQTLNFANSNGITFSNSNGSVIASHDGLTSQSAQIASASNGSFTFQTLRFTDASNVTFGTSAGGIIFASVATAAAGNSINISVSNTSSNVSQIVFSNANGITFGLNGATLTISHNGLTSQSNQAASASNGSFTFQTLGFSNANGITFGTSAGSIITASHNGLTSQSNQAASASNGSFTFQTLGFSNANGITFGTSAGSIVTASHNGITSQSNQVLTMFAASNTTQATSGNQNASSLVFAGAGDVSVGISNGSVVISGGNNAVQFASWYQNQPIQSYQTNTPGVSSKLGGFFQLPYNVSISFVRNIISLSGSQAVNLTSAAATMNASAECYTTFQFGIYTLGTGASSNSITLFTSASVPWTVRNSISVAVNGTEYTITQAYTGASEGLQSTFSRSYAATSSVYSFASSGFLTGFTNGSAKWLDLHFASTLSAGAYWCMVGFSSSSSSQSARVSNATGCNVVNGSYWCHAANSAAELLAGHVNATNTALGVQQAGFVFSSAAQALPNAVDLSSGVTQIASGINPIFQFIRKA